MLTAISALIATAAIGVFHAGVEYHWWAGPQACSGNIPRGLSPEQLKKYLFSAKMVMINGGTIVLMTNFTAPGYIRAIDRQRVDMVTSVPTMLALVAKEHALLGGLDFSSVTHVTMGSAPLISPAVLIRAAPH